MIMDVNESNTGLQKCYNYLKTLTEENSVEKLNLRLFEDLLALSTCPLNEDLIWLIFNRLLKLFRKWDDHFQLSCDISCALGSVLHLLADYNDDIFFDILEKRTSSIFRRYESQNSNFFALDENPSAFLLSMLTFLTNRRRQFQSWDECSILNRKVDEFTESTLPCHNKINMLIAVCHQRLLLIKHQRKIPDSILTDALISTISVVLVHWNHHITDFRRRVRDLFATCLRLNYTKNLKRFPNENPLKVIVNMELFRAFAYDMFWPLPFKYYTYLVGFQFVESVYCPKTFLKLVQVDLCYGFSTSLRSKRVINVETELFKYCADISDVEDWIEIFDPIVNDVLSSDDFITAANFSRYWLPIIARKYPNYCQTIFDHIPSDRKDRTIAHSRILTALLKICHFNHIPLKIKQKSFLRYLEEISYDAEETRGDLFALLCNLNDQSILPTRKELELILSFLRYNVHSCCTLLRQQILSSFAGFVLRLVCSSVRTLKEHVSNDESDAVEIKMLPVTSFLNKLSDFFVDGMTPGCSYQRKVTTLNLYKIFMMYAVRDCGAGRQFCRNNLKDADKLVDYAKKHNSWKFVMAPICERLFRCVVDPCEEIQKLSFALLRGYFEMETLDDHETDVLAVATQMLNDNQFYTRNSAVNAFLNAVALLYNSGKGRVALAMKGLNTEYLNFVQMFMQRLTEQVAVLQEDVLNAAINHPIDATVKVLTFLMTDIRSPEFETVTSDQITKLIELLETIVPILLKALFVHKESDYAPSFEESDNALQMIIKNSTIADTLKINESKEDQFQLQPINQVLLNFIWIALKVCCEFESGLVSSRIQMLDEKQLIRFGVLTVSKLKLCRYKGVIDAAGIALSNIVDTLTAHQMCEQWLDSVLMDLIYMIEYNRGATISRKSAGLSLLIQSVVANDRRPGKPLLTTCWNELRRLLDSHQDNIGNNCCLKQETLQAHVLHFLRVLIADSHNSAYLWPHFEKITLRCLNLLSVPVWTIRNASLQLFGAIAPKIVGQKNSQNDFGVRRSFEEVFLSMPALFDYIITAFEQSTSIGDPASELQRHCDLIPLLILLKSVQVGSENLMKTQMRLKLHRLRTCTLRLLGSQSFFVRELACKTFVSLHSASDVETYICLLDNLRNINNWSTNSKHGYLMMLKQASSMYPRIRNACVGLFGERNNHNCVMTEIQSTPPMILSILYELKLQLMSKKSLITFLICLDIAASSWNKLPKRYLFIGYEELSRVLMRNGFEYCERDRKSYVRYLGMCLDYCSNPTMIENCVQELLTQQDLINCWPHFLIHSVFNFLRTYVSQERSENDIFRVLLVIAKLDSSLVTSTHQYLKADLLFDLNCYRYKALNLLVASKYLLSDEHRMIILECIEGAIREYPHLEALRRNCALAMLTLSENLRYLQSKYRTMGWIIVLNLVQDEENDIRSIGCECYRIAYGSQTYLMQPEMVSIQMHDIDTMEKFLSFNDIVRLLWHTISITRFEVVKTDEIANPFDIGMVNFYREDIKTVVRAANSFLNVISSESVNYDVKYQILEYYESFMTDILHVSKSALESDLLTSVPTYVLSVRCYYLLTIYIRLWHIKIVKNDEISFPKLSNFCERLQKVFNFATI